MNVPVSVVRRQRRDDFFLRADARARVWVAEALRTAAISRDHPPNEPRLAVEDEARRVGRRHLARAADVERDACRRWSST